VRLHLDSELGSGPTFFTMLTTDRGDIVELLDGDSSAFACAVSRMLETWCLK